LDIEKRANTNGTYLPAEKNKGGRPAHVPTPETREIVSRYARLGVRQDLIAAEIEISDETLRKYYRKELTKPRAELGAQVAECLVQRALAGSETSIIFYLKTQQNWKETQEIQHTGYDGMPLGIDCSKDETREEWLARREKEKEQLKIEEK